MKHSSKKRNNYLNLHQDSLNTLNSHGPISPDSLNFFRKEAINDPKKTLNSINIQYLKKMQDTRDKLNERKEDVSKILNDFERNYETPRILREAQKKSNIQRSRNNIRDNINPFKLENYDQLEDNISNLSSKNEIFPFNSNIEFAINDKSNLIQIKNIKNENQAFLAQSNKNLVDKNLQKQSKNVKFFLKNIISIKKKEDSARITLRSQTAGQTSSDHKYDSKELKLNTNEKIKSFKSHGGTYQNYPILNTEFIHGSIPEQEENSSIIINANSVSIYNKSKIADTKIQNATKNIGKKNSIDYNNARKIKRCKRVYDSFSDEEYESEENQPKFLINQNNIIINFWSVLIFLLIIYSCTIEPYLLSFSMHVNWLQYLNVISDFLFSLDIILNFFTPYYKEEVLIRNHKKIIFNYLNGLFILDIISAFPTDIFSFFINDKSAMDYITIFKFLKVFRIFKLVKNDARGIFITNIKFNNDSGINRMLKFGILFLMLSHISSCIWIYLGFLREEVTWITYYGLSNYHNLDIYIASIYFNLVTIFTIGYGDVTSRNTVERIYNICFMFVGVLMFSFAISSLSTIFIKISDEQKRLQAKMTTLDDIHRECQIPSTLLSKLKNTIKFQNKKLFFEKHEIIESLPYVLRKEVILCMNKPGISNLNFFKGQERDFIITVLPLLRSVGIVKNDTLVAIGDHVVEMYIVVKGTLSIRLEKFYGNLEIAQIRENNHFGEIFMYLNENSPYLINCKTDYCDLLSLRKEDYTKIKLSFNSNILMILRKSCQNLENIEKCKKIVVDLHHSGFELKSIKKGFKKLNAFLLQKNFESYFNESFDLEEPEDFILAHEIEDIVSFLNSPMKNEDFQKCFNNKRAEPLILTGNDKKRSSKFLNAGFSEKLNKLKSIKEELNASQTSLEDEDSDSGIIISPKKINKKLSTQTKLINEIFSPNTASSKHKRSSLMTPTANTNKIRRLSVSYDNKILSNMDMVKQEYEMNKKIHGIFYGGKKSDEKKNHSSIASKNKSSTSMSYYKSPDTGKNRYSSDSNIPQTKFNPDKTLFSVNRMSSESLNSYNVFNLYNVKNNVKNNYFVNINSPTIQKCERFEIKGKIKSLLKLKTTSNEHHSNFKIEQNYSMRYVDNKLLSNLEHERGNRFNLDSNIRNVRKSTLFKSVLDDIHMNPFMKVRNISAHSAHNESHNLKSEFNLDAGHNDTPKFTKSNNNKNLSVDRIRYSKKESICPNKLLVQNSFSNSSKVESVNRTSSLNSHHTPDSTINYPYITKKSKQQIKNNQIVSKENLFSKVSSEIHLDELFHLDKLYLMNNLNDFISQKEKYTKKAKVYFKKLDKIINCLKNKKP